MCAKILACYISCVLILSVAISQNGKWAISIGFSHKRVLPGIDRPIDLGCSLSDENFIFVFFNFNNVVISRNLPKPQTTNT